MYRYIYIYVLYVLYVLYILYVLYVLYVYIHVSTAWVLVVRVTLHFLNIFGVMDTFQTGTDLQVTLGSMDPKGDVVSIFIYHSCHGYHSCYMIVIIDIRIITFLVGIDFSIPLFGDCILRVGWTAVQKSRADTGARSADMERGFPMPKGCYYKGYPTGNRREASRKNRGDEVRKPQKMGTCCQMYLA